MMKKVLLILLALASLALTSCGPAAHIVATEIADAARITLSGPTKKTVVVHVDDNKYNIKPVKAKNNTPPAPQQVKQTTSNTVPVSPGSHDVRVTNKSGREVYNNRVSVTKDEHRVISVDNGSKR